MTDTSNPKSPPQNGLAGWWPELLDLVETLEAGTARQDGQPPRSTAEVCAEVDRLMAEPRFEPALVVKPPPSRRPWLRLLGKKR